MITLSICYVSGLLGMLVGYTVSKFEHSVGPLDKWSGWLFIWLWPLLAGIIMVASILGLSRNLTRKILVCIKSLKS